VAVEGKNAAHLIGHITKHKALLFPIPFSSFRSMRLEIQKSGIRSRGEKKERMKKKKHRKSDQQQQREVTKGKKASAKKTGHSARETFSSIPLPYNSCPILSFILCFSLLLPRSSVCACL
jgi:hypothetical protein